MSIAIQLAATDRPAFIAVRRDFQKRMRVLPAVMQRIPDSETAHIEQHSSHRPVEVWHSRHFLALVYLDATPEGIFTRVSVNRTEIENDGHWKQGITWDELMRVKAEIGRSEAWAVEVYPPASQVVNVANLRHLFLVPQPPFAWVKRPNLIAP